MNATDKYSEEPHYNGVPITYHEKYIGPVPDADKLRDATEKHRQSAGDILAAAAETLRQEDRDNFKGSADDPLQEEIAEIEKLAKLLEARALTEYLECVKGSGNELPATPRYLLDQTAGEWARENCG